MRIALISEVFMPSVDGVVTRLCHTLVELGRAGDEVLVIAPAGGPSSYAGARVVSMPGWRMPLYPDGVGYPIKRIALPRPQLRATLRSFDPDVIHVVNPVLLGAGGIYHARRVGVPLVASYHAHLPVYARYYGLGSLESAGWRYIRGLHNLADVNLCTSRSTLARLEQRGIKRLELWPYGTEPERFRPAGGSLWRERLSGGQPGRVILLYVGRLAREKDIARLLPAVTDVEGVTLAIVGDGPERADLERRFAGTSTTFLGLLTGEDLAAAYAAADIFAFPSGTETLGIAMLEARTAGLPVIAADGPTSRELLREGVDGLLFDPDDRGSLARSVARLASEPGLRESMGEAARSAMLDATWESATDTLRAVYRRARGPVAVEAPGVDARRR